MWLDSYICDTTRPYVTWLIHMWHHSFIWSTCAPWLSHMWHDSFTWVLVATSPVVIESVCVITRSYVTWLNHMRRDSFIRVLFATSPALILEKRGAVPPFSPVGNDSWCDMTHVYVTWLMHMWHASFVFGMATISRLHKVIGLFCRISSLW